MRSLSLVAVFALTVGPGAAAAPIADYLAVATATLTITDISSTDDFVITIDPIFEDPEFNIVEDVETSGSGDHEALAEASAALNALDPFDVGIGETLVATASVGGFVDGPDAASADSLALPIIGLTMINFSAVPVVVEFEVAYSLSVSSSAQAPWRQSAAAEANLFVDTLVNPPYEDAVAADTLEGDPPALVEETVSFVVPVDSGEVGQLTFSTGALGLAVSEVPEPRAAAMGIVGGLVLLTVRRMRRVR